jgi:hypothetical protein
MFRGQCGFCRIRGHNVRNCNHPDKNKVILSMENIIETFNTNTEITRYINGLSRIQTELLCCQINAVTGMPIPFQRKSLINWYDAKRKIRQARHEREQNEWDDNMEETSSRASLYPHHLFMECVRLTNNLGKYIRSLFNVQHVGHPMPHVTGIYTSHSEQSSRRLDVNRETYTQYTPIAITDDGFYPRGWKILPDLSKDEFVEAIECPICFQKEQYNKVTLHCNHDLCGTCFVKYIDNSSVLQAPKCPVCRTCIKNVTVYNLDMYSKCTNSYI